MISWRNPGQEQSKLTWDDYVARGPIAALKRRASDLGRRQGQRPASVSAARCSRPALAVMRAQGDDPIASLTLLTSLLDFSDSGILDIFIDETHVRMREQTIGQGGLVPGRESGQYVLQSAGQRPGLELRGEQLPGRPPAARVRSAFLERRIAPNLPGPMYAWYLRNTYLENNLVVPNKVSVCAAPWTWVGSRRRLTCSRHARITSFPGGARTLPPRRSPACEGELEFVLGQAGTSPARSIRRQRIGANYWISQQTPLPERADDWFD